MDNKLEFAQRLREATVEASLEPRPGVLLNLFNTPLLGAFGQLSGGIALAAWPGHS